MEGFVGVVVMKLFVLMSQNCTLNEVLPLAGSGIAGLKCVDAGYSKDTPIFSHKTEHIFSPSVRV